MRRRYITKFIVFHCSATPPNSDIGAQEIDDWHRERGWNEIGYHAVIRRDGTIEWGRHMDEVGAHVKGKNMQSVGVCLVGGVDASGAPADNFTNAQLISAQLVSAVLQRAYPGAEVLGHRDLSPDLNGDGIIQKHEWVKDCPSLDARVRLDGQVEVT